MSKRCCRWHERLPAAISKDAVPEFGECGLAGKGKPYVCCAECPEVKWFLEHRGMKPSDINFAKELVEQS